jgi:hypothetical protein
MAPVMTAPANEHPDALVESWRDLLDRHARVTDALG